MLSHNAQDSQALWEEELKSRSRIGLRLAELEKEKGELSNQVILKLATLLFIFFMSCLNANALHELFTQRFKKRLNGEYNTMEYPCKHHHDTSKQKTSNSPDSNVNYITTHL